MSNTTNKTVNRGEPKDLHEFPNITWKFDLGISSESEKTQSEASDNENYTIERTKTPESDIILPNELNIDELCKEAQEKLEEGEMQEIDDKYGLVIVTYNTQKSKDNLQLFLEKHYKWVDIVLVQEPYWGFIKKVASFKDEKGDDYENTTAHRQFLFLGENKNSRVLTCVNKRLTSLSPRINPSIIKHRDAHCLELNVPNRDTLCILNVYNDPDQYAAQ